MPDQHPLTEITDEMRRAAASAYEDMAQVTRPENHEKCLNAALEAAIAIAPTPTPTPATAEPLARTILGAPEGHGAPHHDADQIKAEDYVMQVDRDGFIRAGKAHCQAADGDWHDENGGIVTWATKRAYRPDALTIWPAPTPPAEEVDLPTEFGDVILNPRWGARSYARAVHLGEGVWAAEVTPGADVYTHLAHDLAAFTLSDGTRVRRDGKHEDGTPRFIQAQEGEK